MSRVERNRQRDDWSMTMSATVLNWIGPFSFFHHASEVPASVLDRSGLYVLAIRYHSKYYTYKPGLTERSFATRLGEERKECLSGKWYLHDPAEALRTGDLPPPICKPGTPGFDPKAADQSAQILDLFLCPSDLDAAQLTEIEGAIHRHFKWLHGCQSPFARMYDELQEPKSGAGPDDGDQPVHSVYEGATIEGLTTVRIDAGP